MENTGLAVKKRSKTMMAVYIMLGIGLIVAIAWPYWELKKLRHDAYWLKHATYGWGLESTEKKQPTYKLISQTVKEIEVVDDLKSYTPEATETVYKKIKARILEIEITNNLDYVYDGYSLTVIDKDGKIYAGSLIPRDGTTEYDLYSAHSSVSLAPGGKGRVVIIVPDDGSEVTRIYDQNMSKTIDLSD